MKTHKLKKHLILPLAAVAMGFTLTSCGGAEVVKRDLMKLPKVEDKQIQELTNIERSVIKNVESSKAAVVEDKKTESMKKIDGQLDKKVEAVTEASSDILHPYAIQKSYLKLKRGLKFSFLNESKSMLGKPWRSSAALLSIRISH